MESETQGSASHWLGRLEQGDDVAAQRLWNRYFSQLVRIADAELRPLSGASEGDHLAGSAFKGVMIGVRENRFPQLNDCASLWPLLIASTARKAIAEMTRRPGQKQAVSAEAPLAEVQEIIGDAPRPEFARRVADELERLVRSLDDPTLALIARRKLEGATHEEIADALGCSPQAVTRKLHRIHREWLEENGASPQQGAWPRVISDESSDSHPAMPLEVVREIDRLCDGFEASLGDGSGAVLAPYLDQVSPAGRAALLRNLAELATEHAAAQGEPDPWARLTDNNPSLASEINGSMAFQAELNDSADEQHTAIRPRRAPRPTTGWR